MGELPVVRMTDGREVVFYTTDYVEARLRSAGRTLKMIPATGCWPARFRSCWPEVVRTYEDAYGWTEADEAVMRPTMRQMNELEQVLGWLPLLARRPGKRHCAKVVAYRMVCHVDTYKPVMSWARVARKMNVDKRTAQAWYGEGISILAGLLNT